MSEGAGGWQRQESPWNLLSKGICPSTPGCARSSPRCLGHISWLGCDGVTPPSGSLCGGKKSIDPYELGLPWLLGLVLSASFQIREGGWLGSERAKCGGSGRGDLNWTDVSGCWTINGSSQFLLPNFHDGLLRVLVQML